MKNYQMKREQQQDPKQMAAPPASKRSRANSFGASLRGCGGGGGGLPMRGVRRRGCAAASGGAVAPAAPPPERDGGSVRCKDDCSGDCGDNADSTSSTRLDWCSTARLSLRDWRLMPSTSARRLSTSARKSSLLIRRRTYPVTEGPACPEIRVVIARATREINGPGPV